MTHSHLAHLSFQGFDVRGTDSAAETGLRAGELAGLRKTHVDLASRRLSVEQSIWKGAVQTPKTESSVRTISISRQLAYRLSAHLARKPYNETVFVFCARPGSPWDANMVVKRKLWATLKTLGFPRCGLHAFRHGNATLMDALGVPLKGKQYRLGHSRAGNITTDVYTHFQTGGDGDVANKIGSVLSEEASNSLPSTCPKRKGLPVLLGLKMFANCAHLVPSRIIPGGISSPLVWLRLRRAVTSVTFVLSAPCLPPFQT
jgi:hypothetical protein